MSPKPPNILFVFSDQHRADALGCYGNPAVRTPNFDALARLGARATCAVSNTPVCGPYRASLMSGRYAHQVRYTTNNLPFEPETPCLAEVLRDAGYATGYVGKWHLHFPRRWPAEERPPQFVPPEARRGFDDFWAAANGGHQYHHWSYFQDDDPTPIAVDAYQPEVQVDLALRFIAERSNSAAPWCLFLSWGPPHTPFDPPPGYAEHYTGAPLPANVPPGRPTAYAQDVFPRYYGLVESLDDAFGRLLAELDRLNAADDTIVVYTSDHGDMLGCHGYRGNKRWPNDASLHVPFIIRWPGRIAAGSTLNRPLGTPDLFPTLVELAGLPQPDGPAGRSAASALLGGDESGRDEFAYCTMPYAYVPWPGWRAIRSDRYLYARTKDAPWLLFDYLDDPLELHNCIDDPACAGLRRALDRQLVERMMQLGDTWENRVEGGDGHLWVAGSEKMRHNDLGVPWPGGPNR